MRNKKFVSVRSKVSLEQFFTYCIERNLPFAFYRLPDTKDIKIVAQKTSSLTKIYSENQLASRKGFLLVPFQENKKFNKVIIKPDIFCNKENLPKLSFASKAVDLRGRIETETQKEVDKKQFLKYLKKIQKGINANQFQKIVAARIVKKKRGENFNAVTFFELLCEEYPTAFVSLAFTKDYGLWVGATPEMLLSAAHKKFKTYSLAGTKENNERNSETHWGKKEKQEQKIVSDYICKTFTAFTKQNPKIVGPESIEAGNLLHLRTTFTYNSIPYSNWIKVAAKLHPTPAVAGYPKQKATEFILENEKAKRNFYSGYLGPVNLDKQVQLFVNLRCMNIQKDKLIVYTGCGITADSNPEKEWKETKIKSETLLGLLKQDKLK